MSSSGNNHAISLRRLYGEIHLIPKERLPDKEEMIPIIEKCLGEGIGVVFPVQKSDPTDLMNLNDSYGRGLFDSLFLKDSVPQIRTANNKRFIEIGHRYLVEAGMEKEAEDYLKKLTFVPCLEDLESIKLLNYLTLQSEILKVMEDMGLCADSSSFFEPPSPRGVFPIPMPDWKPHWSAGEGSNNSGPCLQGLNESLVYEAAIVAETGDSTSTAVEPNPAEQVLHIGEVTAPPMMDAAADDVNKKKGVFQVVEVVGDDSDTD